MSPRKLTEDDKQEILKLYRNSEATTSTLANDYEVSSSTISRFLKNKLSSTEYEDLIQQKRLARTPRGEKSSDTSKKSSTKKKTKAKSNSRKKSAKAEPDVVVEETPLVEIAASEAEALPEAEPEPKSTVRRRRRRSKAVETVTAETVAEIPPIEIDEVEEAVSETPPIEVDEFEEEVSEKPNRLIIDKQPSGTLKGAGNDSEISASSKLILKGDKPNGAASLPIDLEEEEDDDDDVDLVALKEMLGEDLEDFNDDDDEEEEDWEEDNEEAITYSGKASSLSGLEILPLSQASLPRTCYLVIDRSAELIVKPLADFADLGAIPQEEVKQTTLPVFDNHRIAKRFSHRRERVIKVPDGRMIQKTSHHLQDKGITRLLIDGQIYSLSH